METLHVFRQLPGETRSESSEENYNQGIIEQQAELQEADYVNQLAQEQQEDWEKAQVREEINTLCEEGKNTGLYPFVWNYIIFLFPLAFAFSFFSL